MSESNAQTKNKELKDELVIRLSVIADSSPEELIEELNRLKKEEYNKVVDHFSPNQLRGLLVSRINFLLKRRDAGSRDYKWLESLLRALPNKRLAIEVGNQKYFSLKEFYDIVEFLNNL